MQIGESPALGRFVSLRDAYGNTYVYAGLGDVSSVYPVLAAARAHSTVSARIRRPGSGARTGAQRAGDGRRAAALADLRRRRPSPGWRSGPPPALEPAPSAHARARGAAQSQLPADRRAARAGLPRRLQRGLPAPAARRRAGDRRHRARPRRHGRGRPGGSAPHIVFQIRPAGLGAPLIDPKPILDGWVALENTSIFRAKGENPFLATSPTVGQVLLESKQQLEQQVLRDSGIRLARCARQDVQDGPGRQAGAGDARVPVGVGPEADRLGAAVRRREPPARWRPTRRQLEQRGGRASRRSTACRSPATRARGRSPTRPSASC